MRIKTTDIMSVYEGCNKDRVDIVLNDTATCIDNVPFFDKEGFPISYSEALELYGEEGLDHDIWMSEEYIDHINKWLSTLDNE